MKTIAIVAGGDSPEYEVSVRSATEVSAALSSKYFVYVIIIRGTNWYWEDSKGRYFSIDKNDFSLRIDNMKIRFDAVFIAIHGTPGENGPLQGYFDMLGIRYTGCSASCSALTFNKQACKMFLKEYDIPMATGKFVRKEDKIDVDELAATIGLPCFIKPNDSGSSFGVSKANNKEDIIPAFEKAFKESGEAIIETYMNGKEVACGVVNVKGKTIILPVTEIISKNEFFDYEAKYTPGRSDEITPANLPKEIIEEVQRLSAEIAKLLGCYGIVRTDFIIVDSKPLFLEINTVPGMTQQSLIPQQAKAAGLSTSDLYSMIIEDVLNR